MITPQHPEKIFSNPGQEVLGGAACPEDDGGRHRGALARTEGPDEGELGESELLEDADRRGCPDPVARQDAEVPVPAQLAGLVPESLDRDACADAMPGWERGARIRDVDQGKDVAGVGELDDRRRDKR